MNVIGISGFARCGKDTFVGIATNILTKNNYRPMRVAFADVLKDDIDPWLKDKYGISAWTEDPEEKKIIRPFLVAHGCGKRMQTQGQHWIDLVDQKLTSVVQDCLEGGESSDRIVALVSDVRFPNEATWVRNDWGGELIHLKRYVISDLHSLSGECYLGQRLYDPAPNEEESVQDPLVFAMSDYRVEWESRGKLTVGEAIQTPYLQGIVFDVLNKTKVFNGSMSK